jgi:hypothetical protein
MPWLIEPSSSWLASWCNCGKYPFDAMAGRDDFGLPVPPSGPETARARALRKAETRRLGEIILGKLFSRLKSNLGLIEAAKLFEQYSKLVRDRNKAPRNPAHDDFLLQVVEGQGAMTGDRESAPRLAAERLWAMDRSKYGNSVDAIEKHIRRLLKAPDDPQLRNAKRPPRRTRGHKSPTKSRDK